MNITVRYGVVVGLLLLVAACGSVGPSSPTGTIQAPTLTSLTPAPAVNFPPLSGPSRTFVFDRALSYPVSDYTTKSRLVIYDNGAFVLQYPSLGGGYRGGYRDANGVMAFEWEGSSIAGPWGATGTLKCNALTVQYNLNMGLSDFEDAVYTLMP